MNLQLFDLRREPVLCEARAWFTRDFSPETFEELPALSRGERNAWFRHCARPPIACADPA